MDVPTDSAGNVPCRSAESLEETSEEMANSMKKPQPLVPRPAPPRCEFCGEASYSATRIHPQCALRRASIAERAAAKALLGHEPAARGRKSPWGNERRQNRAT